MRELFGGDIDFRTKSKKDECVDKDIDPNSSRQLESCILRHKNFARRVLSESNIAEVIPWHPEDGTSYHCFSFGNVDLFGYLRYILKQQKLKYVGIVCMVISATDIDLLKDWVNQGYIGRLDIGVSKLIPQKHTDLYNALCQIVSRGGVELQFLTTMQKLLSVLGSVMILPSNHRGIQTQTRAANKLA